MAATPGFGKYQDFQETGPQNNTLVSMCVAGVLFISLLKLVVFATSQSCYIHTYLTLRVAYV